MAAVEQKRSENCLPTSVEVFTSQCYMCMCWGNWFLPWMSSFPLSSTWREQCIAVFDFEILSISTERSIFPSKCCPSVWSKSAATLNVLLSLLNLHCVSFEIKTTNGARLLLFACFPAKSISCVVVILYGCVHFSTFKRIGNHWFYKEFNEAGVCGAVMWTAYDLGVDCYWLLF